MDVGGGKGEREGEREGGREGGEREGREGEKGREWSGGGRENDG